MFVHRLYAFGIFFLFCATYAHGQFAPSQLININAENLENKIINGQEVMILTGNVRFSHGMISGSSDKATQYKALNKVILEGNVEIRQDVMLLKAPNVEYDGITGNAKAENGVYLSDRDASVTARKGYYNLNSQKADFEGNVKANQVGTFISSDKLSYFRSSQTTYATGNVEVLSDSGKLTANELTSVRLTGETVANGNVILTNDTTELYCENFYDSKLSGLTTASNNVS
ncbi:MAG TPA: LptA/OstA family protein, partial [Candidatus Kapabacteria bacterium]